MFEYRIRIADITSPKDLIGLKEFTLEITSEDKPEADVFGFAEKIFKKRDEWAKTRNFTFLDQSPDNFTFRS